MEESRLFVSIRNLITGFFKIAIMTVFPVAIRTIVIYSLGDEYLGLGGLFSSIFGALSISELGIASAIVYFLYYSIAKNDVSKVNAYLNALKKIYYVVAGFIFVAGICFIPFLPRLIKSSYPSDINLYLLYLIYLFSACIVYIDAINASASACTLLIAKQRTDIENNIWTLTSTFFYVAEIIALLLFRNYYIYSMLAAGQTFAVGYLRKKAVRRLFPEYKCEGHLSAPEKRQIVKKVVGMFGNKANTAVLNGIDNIFLSAYIGLRAITLYGNYFFVISALNSLFSMIFASVTASIGNAIVTESVEGNYKRFECLFFANAWIIGWATTCLLCLYQVFMQIWMGKDRCFPIEIVIAFCGFFYVSQIRKSVTTFKDANGMWWNDRFRPYVSIVVNLIIDIILIKNVGVIGAIISSLIAVLFVEIPWETIVLFRDYFCINPYKYIASFVKWTISTVGVMLVTFYLCECLVVSYDICGLLLRFVMCLIIPNFFYFVIFGNAEEMRIWKNEIINVLKNKKYI